MKNSPTINSQDVPYVPFPIPGAIPAEGIRARLLNIDGTCGPVTTIIEIQPGATIPAHWHKNGSEAHYVLSGDFINDGVVHGPGAFLTNPAGVVHGPYSSKKGCSVLTVQSSFVDPANPDFHPV